MRFKVSALLTLLLGFGLISCAQPKLEKCRGIEIERPEANNLGEIFQEGAVAEGWEVEMLCGDDIVDIKGSFLKNQMGINPADFYDKNASDFGFSAMEAQTGLVIYEQEQGKLVARSNTSQDLKVLKKGQAWNYDK